MKLKKHPETQSKHVEALIKHGTLIEHCKSL